MNRSSQTCGAAFDLPLRNYTATDFANNVTPDGNHFVIITAVIISDSTVDSAASLSPPVNTLINAPPPPPPPPPPTGGGGGGSFGVFGLLLLMLGCRFRQKLRKESAKAF